MIGLVLVTHGRLAEEFLQAVVHVVGPQEKFVAVSIDSEDNMDNRREDILAAVRQVEDGQGVIIITDMFGGTPSNLAISTMQEGKVEIIAGVNLPMLIKLTSVRTTETISNALKAAQEAGRKYINVPSMILNNEEG